MYLADLSGHSGSQVVGQVHALGRDIHGAEGQESGAMGVGAYLYC